MTTRRGLLAFAGAFLAAPSLVRTPGLLMPVRPWRETADAVRTAFYDSAKARIWVDPERNVYAMLLDPVTWLSAEDSAAFKAKLDAPPRPNPALAALMRRAPPWAEEGA